MSMARRQAAWLLSALAACASPKATDAMPPPLEPGLSIRGLLPRQGRMTVPDLEMLGAQEVTWTFRDQVHSYRGAASTECSRIRASTPGRADRR